MIGTLRRIALMFRSRRCHYTIDMRSVGSAEDQSRWPGGSVYHGMCTCGGTMAIVLSEEPMYVLESSCPRYQLYAERMEQRQELAPARVVKSGGSDGSR